MKSYRFIPIVICLVAFIVRCVPRRKKSEIIKTFNKTTGEATVVENLIQKYEIEHQKFYGKETQNGAYLEWPALTNKNYSHYCSKYLQQSVPTISTDNVIGITIRIALSYWQENTSKISFVVIVHCKVMKENHIVSYYITRAPEANCIYSLKRTYNDGVSMYLIINKHCDFEHKPLINKSVKRKRLEIISQMNRKTGQPIAKDEYLLQYELEHQMMLEKEGKEGKCIEWPCVMLRPNLDYYCYQYMGVCAPGRNREGVIASWKTDKMRYLKSYILKFVDVIIITCVPPKLSKVRYYMTRAPESNCAYALLLKRYDVPSYTRNFFEIIFKHCDFENWNGQLFTSHNYDTPNENKVMKTEVKEEPLDTLGTLQLLVQD